MKVFRQNMWHMLVVALLALLAAGLSFLVASHVYQNRPLIPAENSYWFQARNFMEGRIARPTPAIPDAFHHPMIIMDKEAGWLSRYPPAHPLWLMPGLLFDYPQFMSHIGAALGILLLALTARHLGLFPWLPAGLLLLSPFYLFMYGSWLSHTSGFVFVSAMLLFYTRWQQTQRPMFAALAGLFWGLLLLNRTYTALFLSIPLGMDAALSSLFQRNRLKLRGCITLAGVSTLFFFFYRFYNKLASGSSRMPTFLFYDASEGLGFGPRHTNGPVVHHTLELGMQNLRENILALDQWLWGFTGGGLLVLLLMIIGWRKRWSPLWLGSTLAVGIGYIWFWHPGIEQFRPVYLFEILGFLVLAASAGLQQIWTRSAFIHKHQTLLLITLPLLILAASVPFRSRQIAFFYAHNAVSRAIYDTMHSAPPGSMVLLEGFDPKPLGENMLNVDGMASDPLIARSNPLWNPVLRRLHPERNHYLLTPDSQGLKRMKPLNGIEYIIKAMETHRHTGTNLVTPDGQRLRVANPDFSPGFLLFGRYPYLLPGKWMVRMDYSLRDVAPQHPVRLEIAAGRGTEILAQTNVTKNIMHGKIEMPLSIGALREIEPRVFYGGSGKIWIDKIIVQQVE